jgi:alcohol dehydrogenase
MVASNLARALVLRKPRELIEQEFELPEIKEDDALLQVEACGLCGTDHEEFTGALSPGFSFVPGHETIGTIKEIGPRAAERWSVSKGDRVAVEVFMSCGECRECKAGNYQRCEKHGILDMYGFIPVDKPPSLWGGYAQYQYLAPDTILHKVPARLDPVVATIFNPLGAGIRWGVTVPGTHEGQVVAVLGPGIRGICASAAAKDAGASFVAVTGVGPKDSSRLEVAKSFGADLSIDVSSEDPAKALRKATGDLADVVIDVTAKAPAALGQAVSMAKPGGTIVMAGTRGSAETPGFWPDLIVYKELRIQGALGVDAPAYRAALELLAKGSFPFKDLPRVMVGLDASDVAGLLVSMAGEGEPPPIHGVVVP